MHHRFKNAVFQETSRNAAQFLMLCSLRRALRGTDQFEKNAKGIIICLVGKEWIWHAKSAAMLLMTGGDRSYYDDFRRPVYVIGESARRSTGRSALPRKFARCRKAFATVGSGRGR
jgi:hypothetical protein